MKKISKWELIGYCGVDSGTLMLVDPCYVLPDKTMMTNPKAMEKWAGEHKGYGEMFDEMHKDDTDWKKQSAHIVLSGVGGDGVVVHTYDGDGSYPVFAKFEIDGEHKAIREVKIKFV